MNRDYFDQILQKNRKPVGDAEKMWDEKAAHFNNPKEKSHDGFTDRILEVLEQREILQGSSVLDIGGGGGRYAIPFAKRAKEVTMTDISGNMIAFAREMAEKEKLNNLSFLKMDWKESSPEDFGLTGKFDFVFASMCPAVMSYGGLSAMIRSSKKNAMIAQFIIDTDSFSEFVKSHCKLAPGFHPHNDREGFIAITNLLFLEGLHPSIVYLDDAHTYALEEAKLVETHAPLLERLVQESCEVRDFKNLVERYRQQYGESIKKYRKLALLSWERESDA